MEPIGSQDERYRGTVPNKSQTTKRGPSEAQYIHNAVPILSEMDDASSLKLYQLQIS